uniref:Chromosome 2 open reading frame 68 n=1 Tax=Fundulus heteroclitus TaxID=8078 RepID=A0A3Q2QTV4_FUNHE
MDILRDEGVHDLKYKPGGRLDMSHGFLHHIRRNQIARDDYDKEVKQAKELQRRRHTTTPRRPRRPDIQVYHPRQRRGSEPEAGADPEEWNESGSSTETESNGTELFWLDYQEDSGAITSFLVHKVAACLFCLELSLLDPSLGLNSHWFFLSFFLQEDKPEKVVERVAEKNVLDAAMRAALEVRIRKEIEKRRDNR